MGSVDESEPRYRMNLVRDEFGRRREAGLDEGEALQATAVDLGFSLGDCASAVGLEDLVEAMGDTWEIADEEGGPTRLRRPGRLPRDS